MTNLKMHTPNKADENFTKLAQLFPNAVTETINENGEVVRAIDKDVLMQEISTTVVEGREERYQFTWPDKKKSVLLANSPISKTLRPCREESVDFDNTENLYIEGDNLEVLKLLQETYLGKIKMIYIDPPYNTGNDFVYEDDFAQDADEYLANSGQFDEEGNRLFQNTERNGRFHTDWLNMIYPRLKLARDLLTDDGVIFISIDDNEVENLNKVCKEIFGEQNFIANIIWQKKYSPQNDAKWFSSMHDFIVCVSKNKDIWRPVLLPRTAEQDARYTNRDNDPRGPWKSSDLSVKTYSADYDYPITTPSGRVVELPAGRCWMTSKVNMQKLIDDNRIWFGESGDNVPSLKRFLSDVKQGITPSTIWFRDDVGDNQEGKQELVKLMPENVFQTPKVVRLLKRIVYLSSQPNNNDLILDFFSGSATTAHAVMQLNAEDGGNRKFIMVQMQEETNEKSEAYKAGYKNICEIGKERIRRASTKIAEENPEAKFDGGFRVLKCDSTNMKDVYYNPSDFTMSMLTDTVDNIPLARPRRRPSRSACCASRRTPRSSCAARTTSLRSRRSTMRSPAPCTWPAV